MTMFLFVMSVLGVLLFIERQHTAMRRLVRLRVKDEIRSRNRKR